MFSFENLSTEAQNLSNLQCYENTVKVTKYFTYAYKEDLLDLNWRLISTYFLSLNALEPIVHAVIVAIEQITSEY